MGLISRVSSRTYRESVKHYKPSSIMFKRTAQRAIASWKKPFPTQESQAIGITKIQLENKNNPQGPFRDPFEGSIHKSDYVPTKGSGTKDDPFIIPARNPFRQMWKTLICTVTSDHSKCGGCTRR